MIDLLDRPTRSELLSDAQWFGREPRLGSLRQSFTESGISTVLVYTVVPFGPINIVINEALPEWSREPIERISRLGGLRPNWDSYGAKPVDPYCAMAAIQLVLASLGPDIPAPAVVPLNRGGIQLEWHRQGVDLEIAVHSLARFVVTMDDEHTGQQSECVITSDFRPLPELLARISNKD